MEDVVETPSGALWLAFPLFCVGDLLHPFTQAPLSFADVSVLNRDPPRASPCRRHQTIRKEQGLLFGVHFFCEIDHNIQQILDIYILYTDYIYYLSPSVWSLETSLSSCPIFSRYQRGQGERCADPSCECR